MNMMFGTELLPLVASHPSVHARQESWVASKITGMILDTFPSGSEESYGILDLVEAPDELYKLITEAIHTLAHHIETVQEELQRNCQVQLPLGQSIRIPLNELYFSLNPSSPSFQL
jgi:hypothetical protein